MQFREVIAEYPISLPPQIGRKRQVMSRLGELQGIGESKPDIALIGDQRLSYSLPRSDPFSVRRDSDLWRRNLCFHVGVQHRNMLEAHELTKSYASVIAVTDVTFSLSRGQVLGCLGPNGSGKSTTFAQAQTLLADEDSMIGRVIRRATSS
jgi:ABC-type multidrug transport system fused ATPase/permease subunit